MGKPSSFEGSHIAEVVAEKEGRIWDSIKKKSWTLTYIVNGFLGRVPSHPMKKDKSF